jgi:uncharacterized NAD(P)/FAD-binding protein YdhS
MSTRKSRFTIAIVGGGAIGAGLFDRLVDRLSDSASLVRARVALFDKSDGIGRGLAYARDPSPYLLNQSAQTMSLVPGRPGHFCEWLEERGVVSARNDESFCARQTFGDYLEESFARALGRAERRGLHVTTVRDEVKNLRPRRLGGYRVVTRTNAPVDADVVVLAVGNLPSTKFERLTGPGFVASPFPSEEMCARIPKGARVAILGSGLSAADTAVALFAHGHEGAVTMCSRSGLLPAVRGPLVPHELRAVTRANVARTTDDGRRPLRWHTILGWLGLEFASYALSVAWDRDFPVWIDALEHYTLQIADAERGSRVWQSIGEALNPMIEVLWHHLAEEDRGLFLSRVYSRFMSYWVPIPLVTARRILTLLRDRKLTVERGLAGVTSEGGAYRVRLPAREATFDFVVDATGTPRHVSECHSPLLRALLDEGTVTSHERGGVRVDFESLRVITKNGHADPSLFAIGNLTSGTHLFTSTLERNVEKGDRIAALIVADLERRIERGQRVDAPSHSS